MPSSQLPRSAPKAALSYDTHGTPGVWAEDPTSAYYAIGYLHGRHRPLQVFLLVAAAQGRLAELILPRPDLVHLSALAMRLDLSRRGIEAAQRLPAHTTAYIDAYCAGVDAALLREGLPHEMRLLRIRMPPLNRAVILSNLMLAAYLGLAEGQERMERALLELLEAGANPQALGAMFSPHLADAGKEPFAVDPVSVGFADLGSGPKRASGGSNAWAVAPGRSKSGASLFACDPHLQVNILPALFLELRARVGSNFWLGATIPGLPGIAVGRNRTVAWGGTFGVADNVDSFRESVGEGTLRQMSLGRRGRKPLSLSFWDTPRGTRPHPNSHYSVAWAGVQDVVEAMTGYLDLPSAESAADAERILARSTTFSLHFVLADKREVRYCHRSSIPQRDFDGLLPAPLGARWGGLMDASALPRQETRTDFVATANEARTTSPGLELSPFAQPDYRLGRIEHVLASSHTHTIASMQALQLDVVSLQAQSLLPALLPLVPKGEVQEALVSWNATCDVASRGAHAFALLCKVAQEALASELGGQRWLDLLESSETSVWWCKGIDRLLAKPTPERQEALVRAFGILAFSEVSTWGEVQRVNFAHPILGGLPPWTGYNRGPHPLPGQIGTVRQGKIVRAAGQEIAVAPAYRFVCDLGEEQAWSAIPGGIDGSRFSSTYDHWLLEWQAGNYHPLRAPQSDEQQERI